MPYSYIHHNFHLKYLHMMCCNRDHFFFLCSHQGDSVVREEKKQNLWILVRENEKLHLICLLGFFVGQNKQASCSVLFWKSVLVWQWCLLIESYRWHKASVAIFFFICFPRFVSKIQSVCSSLSLSLLGKIRPKWKKTAFTKLSFGLEQLLMFRHCCPFFNGAEKCR